METALGGEVGDAGKDPDDTETEREAEIAEGREAPQGNCRPLRICPPKPPGRAGPADVEPDSPGA